MDCRQRIGSLRSRLNEAHEASDWPEPVATLVSTILDCPVSMLVAWGPDLNCLFNDAYDAALGELAADAMGQPLHDHWRHGWDEIGPLVHDALAGKARKLANVPLRSERAGSLGESWWDFAVSPIRDQGGTIGGVLCLATETTALVLTDRTRQAASGRLREALAAGIPIGSWDWDVVNDLVYSDSRFALIYCVEPERAKAGSPLRDFLGAVHPDDRDRVRAEIKRAVVTGDPYLSEYRILGVNGEELWMSAQGTPVMDDDGRCVRFPGLTFDITAKKKFHSAA